MYTHRLTRLFVALSASGLLVIALMLGLFISGTQADAAGAVAGDVAAPRTLSGAVTLWYAYDAGSAEEAALTQVIANAQTANPGLTVNAVRIPYGQTLSRYTTEYLAGGGPDMFVAQNDGLGAWVRSGMIRNLDAHLQGRLTNVYPTAVDGMRVDGQLYGVPESAKAAALYYNKSRVTAPPTTTADLLSLVQDGHTVASPAGGAYFFYGFWNAFGGQLMDGSGRCVASRGGFAQAMQYLLDLQGAGATLEIDYDVAQSQFLSGATDMFVNGPWALAAYDMAMGDNLGVTLLPAGPIDIARPMNDLDGFYINPHTINFTSTVELALFMTNQASAQIFTDTGGHIPVRSDVTSARALANTFAQASVHGSPRPQSAQLDNYWQPFADMITNVLAGVISPRAGVAEACAAMNRANGFPPQEVLFLPMVRR